jgi:hypothetical protein
MHRTLIVANRTASTPVLLQEIERRAARQPTSFVLLVPAGSREDWTVDEALRSLRKAARGPTGFLEPDVEGAAGGTDAVATVRQTLTRRHFDDLIVSTLPARRARGSLAAQLEGLGLPTTVIAPPAEDRSLFGMFSGRSKNAAAGRGY